MREGPQRRKLRSLATRWAAGTPGATSPSCTTAMTLRSALRASFLLPLLLLTACDSGDDDDNGPGTGNQLGSGTAVVTGDIDAEFSGSAVFTVVTDDTLQTFLLVIANGNPTQVNPTELVTFGRAGGRPAVGTYAFDYEEGEDVTMIAGYIKSNASGEESVTLGGLSGELVITESSNSRVKGTYEFSGVVVSDDGEEAGEATASGSFDAVFVEDDGDRVGAAARRAVVR